MVAQKGKDLLLKIDNGSGGFITIGGLRTRRLAFNAETVDMTHAESVGRWRELLAGAGVRRFGRVILGRFILGRLVPCQKAGLGICEIANLPDALVGRGDGDFRRQLHVGPIGADKVNRQGRVE